MSKTGLQTTPAYTENFSFPTPVNLDAVRSTQASDRSPTFQGLVHSRTGARAPNCSQEVLDRMLLEKAKEGDVTEVKYFTSVGANPNAKDMAGRSARHLAAIGGHIEVMQALRDAGADIYAQDYAGDHGFGVTADEYLTLWTRTGHRNRPESRLQAYAAEPLDAWDPDTAQSLLTQYTQAYEDSFSKETKAAYSNKPEDISAAQESALRLLEIDGRSKSTKPRTLFWGSKARGKKWRGRLLAGGHGTSVFKQGRNTDGGRRLYWQVSAIAVRGGKPRRITPGIMLGKLFDSP